MKQKSKNVKIIKEDHENRGRKNHRGHNENIEVSVGVGRNIARIEGNKDKWVTEFYSYYQVGISFSSKSFGTRETFSDHMLLKCFGLCIFFFTQYYRKENITQN